MPSIRKTRTASGATAVQVVRYERRTVVVLKHIGSARTPEEIVALTESAAAWIERTTAQRSLFPKTPRRALSLATTRYRGVTHAFSYTVLSDIAARCGFTALHSPLLLDLAIMRIVEPCSKLRSIALLERHFGIRYAARSVYRTLPRLLARKADAERIAVAFAQRELSCDLSFVLYDVTTLYFETFTADDLRVPGFSKDQKPQQPQIVVGLLVTPQGFPLGSEVFRGNTFEGKTMLPIIEAFRTAYGVTTCTVVADAGMLSLGNIAELQRHHLSYIVGARMASCPSVVIERVCAPLCQRDGATVRIPTEYGDLIGAFSAIRYRKDTHELDRQVARAEALVAAKEPGRRARFVTARGEAYALHTERIARARALLGVKGYYTNIPPERATDHEIIAHYRNLWRVEQAFRMSKSDLATRPIFHHMEDAIRAHVLICFIALAMGKYLEIATGLSLRRIVDILWSVTDAQLIDTTTGEVFTLRSEPDTCVRTLLKELRLSY